MSRACLALCLALLLPVGASAQTIDQDSAQKLRQDLQSWFAGLLGPGVGATVQRLQVTPEADHFRVALPYADATGDREVNADVRPLPGGRWSVDALRLPDATRFTLLTPQPGGPPDQKVPTDFRLRIGSQNNHALIDPALASPSQLDIDLGHVRLLTDSPGEQQEQRIGRYTVQAILQPHGKRLDLLEQGTIIGWDSASRVGDKAAVGFGADSIQANGQIDGIDRDRGAALLTAIGGLMATLPPAAAAQHGHVPLSAPARAALRTLIESLRGIITDIRAEETIDGLHIAVAGKGEATVRHVRFGIDGAAPDGMLHAAMNIALDGLTVGNLPPEETALVPHHLVLRPSVAGVSLAGLTALALLETDPHPDPAKVQADREALLAHGGVTVGLDALEMDVGPAELHGHGRVLLTGANDYAAQAHITATGFDALMQQAAVNPSLQRALPFLALARGFARPEGDRLVWDIAATKAGLTVNGIPLRKAPDHGHHPDRPQPDRPHPDQPHPDRP